MLNPAKRFMVLALEDLRRADALFRSIFDSTDGVDGWVSMEVSPLLAQDTAGSIAAAAQIHAQADRANLFVKIPGTPEGIPAIEESIFSAVPINVTLLLEILLSEVHSPMKKLIVFDLDGTLAESKSSLDAEMATLLTALQAL